MADSSEEREWYVRLDTSEVVAMTLSELEEAFSDGRVHAETYLLERGGSDWVRFAEAVEPPSGDARGDPEGDSRVVATPNEAPLWYRPPEAPPPHGPVANRSEAPLDWYQPGLEALEPDWYPPDFKGRTKSKLLLFGVGAVALIVGVLFALSSLEPGSVPAELDPQAARPGSVVEARQAIQPAPEPAKPASSSAE